jgi:hypothetical protein
MAIPNYMHDEMLRLQAEYDRQRRDSQMLNALASQGLAQMALGMQQQAKSPEAPKAPQAANPNPVLLLTGEDE